MESFSSAARPLTISWNQPPAGVRTPRVETLKPGTTWATNTIQIRSAVPGKSTINVIGRPVRHAMPGDSIRVVPLEWK